MHLNPIFFIQKHTLDNCNTLKSLNVLNNQNPPIFEKKTFQHSALCIVVFTSDPLSKDVKAGQKRAGEGRRP